MEQETGIKVQRTLPANESAVEFKSPKAAVRAAEAAPACAMCHCAVAALRRELLLNRNTRASAESHAGSPAAD
jgi:hypothetical protein